MREIGSKYKAVLEPLVRSKSPAIPFFSTVHGEVIASAGQLDATYWRKNLESPVLFSSSVQLILCKDSQRSVFLEIGPHSTLAGPLREIIQHARRQDVFYLTALTRLKDCTESILKMAGELFLHGISLNFAKLTSIGRVLTDMPLYQWQHGEKYWSESRVSREWRLRQFPHHGISTNVKSNFTNQSNFLLQKLSELALWKETLSIPSGGTFSKWTRFSG